MKKFFKFFFIILINLLILFIVLEYLCFLSLAQGVAQYQNKEYKNLNIIQKFKILKNYKYSRYALKNFDEVYKIIKENNLRKPVGLEYTKKPILIMGCSYAYGWGLDEKDTLGYKLSQIMKRPVYNRAYGWYWGLQTMLYQARRKDFYEEVPEPEYIIYVFIDDHINRICRSDAHNLFPYPHLRYIKRNGQIVREKFPQRYNLYIFRKYTLKRHYGLLKTQGCNLAVDIFKETKKEFDKHWSNYKFIILVYQDHMMNKDLEENIKFNELEKDGFIVIKSSELTGRIMNRPEDIHDDKIHPSKNAWSIIAPKLAEKLI